MGGKRVGTDTYLQPKKKKCAKKTSFLVDGDGDDDDRISQLPHEIRVDILSLLPVKEAARTSVLSSRWVNLWKYTTSLNFDALAALEKLPKREDLIPQKFVKSEGLKYVKWVNSALRSHDSPTLKEFIIRFPLDIRAESSITQWLQFAFARQVERLELNLKNRHFYSRYYCFPKEFLTLTSCRAPKLQNPFKPLKELCFKGLHLDDGVIEFFLHNCRLLERLVVHLATKISNIEVCGPSLRLKHLEIYDCSSLKSLKVSAPNLTSLRVSRPEGLLLEYVPMLVEVSVRCCLGYRDSSVKPLLHALSCCFLQLEVLCLKLSNPKEKNELFNFPETPKLKKLVVTYLALDGDECFAWLIALIRSSPFLEEFELKYKWSKLSRKGRKVTDMTRSPHHHLKVFKFGGYYGRTTDAELIKYILENCVVLEKIIIDPSGARSRKRFVVLPTARRNAKKQVEPLLPHNVELVML